MRDDFIAFKQYYRQAIKQVPEDSFYRQTIIHKFKHAIEVLHIGQTLLDQTPELQNQSKEFKHLAQVALLFHDVGRFEEAVLQYADQKENIIVTATSNKHDHGLIGYKLLKQNPAYNDMRILFAVKWHGKLREQITSSADWQQIQISPDFDSIKKILFLVRDADKLANLNHIKNDNHLTKDFFYHQLTTEALHAPLSTPVLEQFLIKQTVLLSNIYSFADRVLMVLSWIFDLNYQTSYTIFKTSAYDKYLLNLLAEYDPDPEVNKIIRKQFYSTWE